MTGSWTAPIGAPFCVGVMLLLTDGSVLAQDSGTYFWWRLYPDRAGRYAQGEWRRTANSTSAPLHFASAVLKDGRVLVCGGEYSNNGRNVANLGSAEVYDPTTEAWRSLSPPPSFPAIGDAPCCVLDDGRVLLGNIKAGPCWIWEPEEDAWSSTSAKANGSSKHECWTLLPDGSVLAVDCLGEGDSAGSRSERYHAGAWADAGPTPRSLVEGGSLAAGPAVLLNDGTVFAIGATGATARYRPGPDPDKPGDWTAGPDAPLGGTDGQAALGAARAPACLLPNGRLLCVLAPVTGGDEGHPAGGVFHEFDGATPGAWSPTDAPPGGVNAAPDAYILLLLPSGEVLVSERAAGVHLFRPDGGADPAGVPVIETCPDTLAPGGDYPLEGRRLNGLSQACARGGDATVATNYPIVRLRAAFPSDTLVYCRTHDHSTMGVATGRSVVSTRFTVPGAIGAGIWNLEVVANGVVSPPRAVNVVAPTMGEATDAAASSRAMFAQGETFERSLSEVHLLLDFISGRADKSLADLTDVTLCDAGGKPTVISAPCVVEEICKISYPPRGGAEAQAAQAAFILLVTDKLNHLAYPARGLTIAFTAMFSGVKTTWLSRIRKSLDHRMTNLRGKKLARANEAPVTREEQVTPSAASIAYPQFELRAAKFRSWYDALPHWAAILLFLVIYLNWDVSITTSGLNKLSDSDKAYHEMVASSKLPTTDARAAEKLAELTADQAVFEASLRERWYTPLGLSVHLFAPAAQISPRGALETFTGSLIDGANTIIIPALFGWLGTLAGLVRSITAKLRDNVLAPRDFSVSRASIFLGVVAGLAVGLFIKTTGQSDQIILPAGLSFLAGFGAEAFFGFLDGLLTRIFAPQANPGGNVSAGTAARPPR